MPDLSPEAHEAAEPELMASPDMGQTTVGRGETGLEARSVIGGGLPISCIRALFHKSSLGEQRTFTELSRAKGAHCVHARLWLLPEDTDA